jgi:hypothetical protein
VGQFLAGRFQSDDQGLFGARGQHLAVQAGRRDFHTADGLSLMLQ